MSCLKFISCDFDRFGLFFSFRETTLQDRTCPRSHQREDLPFHLSLHCWQADDVAGFEVQAGSLTGGIQATGNYPGKARNIDELRADILKAASYIPGTHRLNLHEIYGDFQGKVVDRDQVEPEHFKSWIEWGKEHNMKLDFNSTSFSHPKSGDLSLSNPDEGIRQFWIEHTKRCRAVAEEMGKARGGSVYHESLGT